MMETVVTVMMLSVCFNFLLKQTFRKAWHTVLSAIACALFAGAAWPCAAEQSKTRIADWLADSALMLDAAVVLTIEVALQMAFCLLEARMRTSERAGARMSRACRLLRWFPGLLILPVLFYALVAAIFALPGVSFALIAWLLAGALLVAIPLGAWVVGRLLPETEIRLELLFLSNALLAVLGIVATVNGRAAVAAVGRVDWQAAGGVLLLVATGVAAGIGAYGIKRKNHRKRITP